MFYEKVLMPAMIFGVLANGQTLQVNGQSHIVEGLLVEAVTKGQPLQAPGQSYLVHALVKLITKRQALQAEGRQVPWDRPASQQDKPGA